MEVRLDDDIDDRGSPSTLQPYQSSLNETVIDMDVPASKDFISEATGDDSRGSRASSVKFDLAIDFADEQIPQPTLLFLPVKAESAYECKIESKCDSPASCSGEDTNALAVPPDGGLRAWLNVLGGFLVLFSSFGVLNAMGAFQAYYEHVLFPNRSSSDIAWIGSTQLCLFFLCATVVGPLFDKGYFRVVMLAGSAFWTTSIFLIPQMTTFGGMMAVQGVLGGLGVGFLFLPTMSIQCHWFTRRRALAIGIVASGSSAGGICFPIVLNKFFVDPNIGFANGVRSCGYVVVACLAIANCIMAPNPGRKLVQKPPPPPIRQMLTGPFVCLVLGAFLLSFGLWFPSVYDQLYFQANGASMTATTHALAFFHAGTFFGRTVPNCIADHIGPFNVQVVCCFTSAVVVFCMKVMTSEALLILNAVLFGFFGGAFIALLSPVIVSLSNDLSEIGLRQGIAFFIIAGSSLAGNPIAGRLLANNLNDFTHPITFAGTMILAGSVPIAVGRCVRAKEKGTWRV
ncbi:hypothetical protein JCM3770_007373 [Rhodotorula araucariae]